MNDPVAAPDVAAEPRPAAAQSSAASRRPMAEDDLLNLVWVADPQISPDGTQVVFTRVTVNEPKDEYETSLWMVPASGAERIARSDEHDFAHAAPR